MATKKTGTKTTQTKATETKVTRISASDTSVSTKKPSITEKKIEKKPKKVRTGSSHNPFRAIGAYFAGAWYELRQVRWPNRRETWGMTGALLGFTAFFVIIILLLDALFQYLFKLILG